MPAQLLAILWAQWKTLIHFRRHDGLAGSILSGLLLLVWYAWWTTIAAVAGLFASRAESKDFLETYLPQGLLCVVLYWQLVPVLMASLGASLDLKKLLVYPIPSGQLFGVDVVLRLSTCTEMLLVIAGVTAGLAWNPALTGKAAPAAFLFFVLFNLLLASGLRHQIERLMARRRLRELFVILLVTAAALPQLLFATGTPALLRRALAATSGPWWPWSAAARLALGHLSLTDWAAVLFWTAAAWFFGRWQFARSLRFDQAALSAGGRRPARPGSRMDAIYRLPSRLFSDPLAALVEKELRSLARSPRFRLVFVMGFTFGVLVFLPLVLRNRHSGGDIPVFLLPLMCAYALLLLGDVIFWNIFGLDRRAAQLYFLQPLRLSLVVLGKNLAAGFFVLAEITAVIFVWVLLRMPTDMGRITEAYAVPLVLCVYLLGAGNLASVYYPRPVSPERSTGAGSSARVRIMLLLAYPVLALPVLLAYGARYAFRNQAAFYGVLGFAALLGAAIYWAALETAVAKSEVRKEILLEALSQSQGPIRLM